MPSGVRANSLLVVATPSGLVRSLDDATEFLDRDGVPRRRVRGTNAQRLVVRGSSLSGLDIARVIHRHQDDDDEEVYEQEDYGELHHQERDVETLSLDEKLMLERAHQAKMVRRQRMILELRDRKRMLLVDQHEQILTRVELWHLALALDPDAELTSAHTSLSPSRKAYAFIDDDGNVRRKAVAESLPHANSSFAAAAAAASASKSIVLEFVQILLED